MGDKKGDLQGSVLTEEVVETKEPPLYKVLLHNDDYTTMEFVVHVLTKFFQVDETRATQIMLHVHHKGYGIVGTFTRRRSETGLSGFSTTSTNSDL